MTKDPYRDLLLAELDRSEALRARTTEDAAFSEETEPATRLAGRAARAHASGPLGKPPFPRRGEILPDRPLWADRHQPSYRRGAPDRAGHDARPAGFGLATVAHAVELNALSESLDGAMVEALGDRAATIDAAAYADAYRTIDRVEDRARQIELIERLGKALDKLTHIHFIGMTLKMMRGPARLAGLGELQAFLERGYSAFGAMRGGASEFVTIVVDRERTISRALLAGDDEALRRRPEPPARR